jgi:N-acetylglucosamine kinase-like BadF-type ATPase
MNAGGHVLAVDGGGAKTDLALLNPSGALLALVRGGGSSPHYLGVDGCVELLEGLRLQALRQAGLTAARATTAQILLAGADLPEELETLQNRISVMEWSEQLVVENDTLALLRSGTERGWGVAVVCGAGINGIGIAPDGRRANFLALGSITGDWGGGADLGLAALAAAARSADGRGPRTVLASTVPAHFGMQDPLEVSRALHLRELRPERLRELAAVVFAASPADHVAATIVNRLTDEVISYVAAALRRLELVDADPDVVLGGGLIRAAPPSAIERIREGVAAIAEGAHVIVAPAAPILGAALLALDDLGAGSDALARARADIELALANFAAEVGDGSLPPDAHELVRSARG